jgi:hypothetical protein
LDDKKSINKKQFYNFAAILKATSINYFFARNKYNKQDARHKYFLIA